MLGSNHTACEKVVVNLFNQIYNNNLIKLSKIMLKYYFSIIQIQCSALKRLMYIFFILSSEIKYEVGKLFNKTYDRWGGNLNLVIYRITRAKTNIFIFSFLKVDLKLSNNTMFIISNNNRSTL